ncbi:MAG: hypothetical protein ABH860_04130 [bacterium]
MKKTIIALVAMMMLASSAFAGVSFLTAPSVGEGKWAVLGMYATNHNGAIANSTEPQDYDANSIGIRGEYGVMKDIDLLVAYSFDTLPNIKDVDNIPNLDEAGKQTSGNTTSLGIKYSLGKIEMLMDVDMAVGLGYELSDAGIKLDAGGSTALRASSKTIGCVFSKKIDNFMPYGSIGYKMLAQDLGKLGGLGTIPTITGTGLALNIGCMIGVAENQAVAVEYNTENQAWDSWRKSAAVKDEASAVNVSGISLGYVYVF